MISIKDFTVDLGEFMLENVNLDIEEGQYYIILGPTGAGKTVLLEAIAGLYPVVGGEAWVDGVEITGLKPEKRGVGIVYQDQMLFPHMSVEKNIGFGLKLRKMPKQEIAQKVNVIAGTLGVDHLLHRKPGTLSGGEQQRVALARALVAEPKVLLLDEPLSALDPETRERLQQELKEIHRKFNVTIVHVTHDFEEAIALGERVAVLNDGKIVQTGKPDEVLRQPNSEFVARFALTRNVYSGIASDGDRGYESVDVDGATIQVATEMRGPVRMSLRPEDILISKEPIVSTARNCLAGKVSRITERGAVVYVTVTVPPDFVCMITKQSYEDLDLREEVTVYITFKASAVHVF